MTQMKPVSSVTLLFIIISLVIIAAVSFHSVEEIHYLKSFYPHSFTVAESKDAAIVELIKVLLISLPLILIVICGLFLFRLLPRNQKN